MKFNQTNTAYATGIMMSGIISLLLLMAIFVPFRFFVQPIDRSETSMSGRVQEEIGYQVVALTRFDQDRRVRLQQEGEGLFQKAKIFVNGRSGRLQEILGKSIAQTAQMVVAEQKKLKRDVVEAKEEVRSFNREKSARWQEKLGQAAVMAYRRVGDEESRFHPVFEQEATRLKRVEERTSGRLQSELGFTIAKEAQFNAAIPLLYQEAIQSAHRSVRMLDESQMSWTQRNLNDVIKNLSWKRQSQDYVHLGGVIRENLAGRSRLSGFAEYGLPALAGLFMVMVWMGSTISTRRITVNRR